MLLDQFLVCILHADNSGFRISNFRSSQQTWKNYLSWLKLGNENLEKFRSKLDENAVNIYSLDSLDGARKNLEVFLLKCVVSESKCKVHC